MNRPNDLPGRPALELFRTDGPNGLIEISLAQDCESEPVRRATLTPCGPGYQVQVQDRVYTAGPSAVSEINPLHDAVAWLIGLWASQGLNVQAA